MSENKKRAAPESGSRSDKRAKTNHAKSQGGKKQWRVPKQSREGHTQPPSIETGDAGIWVTCELHKEAKCVGEVKDLFYEYAEELYGPELDKIRKEKPARKDASPGDGDKESANKGDQAEDEAKGDDGALDIEAEIAAEVKDLRKPTTDPLFTNVKIDVQCEVLFLKTRPPIEPVTFIHHICTDLLSHPEKRRTRFAKRFTPMSMMGKATEAGLEGIARAVLPVHFHGDEVTSVKYAIRPSSRNHSTPLNRDYVIKTIADMVGPWHTVDLKNPDLVILVEVYTNICGMSVVSGPDFEKLKKFNVAEIGAPPKEAKAQEE